MLILLVQVLVIDDLNCQRIFCPLSHVNSFICSVHILQLSEQSDARGMNSVLSCLVDNLACHYT